MSELHENCQSTDFEALELRKDRSSQGIKLLESEWEEIKVRKKDAAVIITYVKLSSQTGAVSFRKKPDRPSHKKITPIDFCPIARPTLSQLSLFHIRLTTFMNLIKSVDI